MKRQKEQYMHKHDGKTQQLSLAEMYFEGEWVTGETEKLSRDQVI